MLSAILLSREALDRVLEILKPEHFYSDANGRIYDANTLDEIWPRQKPLDPPWFADERPVPR